MKLKKILFTSLTFSIAVIINATRLFAGTTIYWDINDIPLGIIYEHNGLEIIHFDNSENTSVVVESCNKTYDGKSYNKAINLKGTSSVGANYVPKSRALKFQANQDSILTIYAYGGTTGLTNNMSISCEGSLIETLSTDKTILQKYNIVLPKNDTYYIYGSNFRICYMEVSEYCKGDIDLDGKLTFEDVKMLDKYLKGTLALENWQLKLADYNKDGSVDITDRKLMFDIVKNTEEYKSNYFSDKTWDVESMFSSDMTIGKYSEFDGLGIFSAKSSDAVTINLFSRIPYKPESLYFTRRISTNGGAYASNYVPEERAITFNTNQACYAHFYVMSSTTTQTEPYFLVTRKGEAIDKFKMDVMESQKSGYAQKFTVYLPEADRYYAYSDNISGGVSIYRVVLEPAKDVAERISKTETVTKDKEYQYYLTANTFKLSDSNGIYELRYNPSEFELKSIGADSLKSTSFGFTKSDEVEIVNFASGVLTFKIKEVPAKFDGILTLIKFKSKITGTTSIQFGV